MAERRPPREYPAPPSFANAAQKKPEPGPEAYHPQMDDNGNDVPIYKPSASTDPATWADPASIATVVPGGAMPAMLNGIPLAPWADAPTDLEGWANVEGQAELDEPPFHGAPGMKIGAGVVVQEPDGRVWIVHPTNGFGGYKGTLPKGTVEDGLSMQASAIKEAFEESGLKVEITGHLMDVKRTTSVARFYAARRVGGTPSHAGWESQAVSLVPVAKLYDVLNRRPDHGIAEALGATKSSSPPKPETAQLVP